MKEIKWKNGGEKLIFGEVGKYTLFYIRDNNYGGGLFRYELEIKFIDQRWTSNSIDELKSQAQIQLEGLQNELTY